MVAEYESVRTCEPPGNKSEYESIPAPKTSCLLTKDVSEQGPREQMANRYQGGAGVFII